jgi:hypothetical protein
VYVYVNVPKPSVKNNFSNNKQSNTTRTSATILLFSVSIVLTASASILMALSASIRLRSVAHAYQVQTLVSNAPYTHTETWYIYTLYTQYTVHTQYSVHTIRSADTIHTIHRPGHRAMDSDPQHTHTGRDMCLCTHNAHSTHNTLCAHNTLSTHNTVALSPHSTMCIQYMGRDIDRAHSAVPTTHTVYTHCRDI